MTRWAVVTGEYPPQPGGVSDYTRQVAAGLAVAGDRVTVYAPACPPPESADSRVTVHRLPDHFGRRGLAALTDELRRTRPDRILVQYVPHAFGRKGMNLPFAWWVRRARRLAPVWVMFHEVAFPFVRRPLRHNLIAVANRLMARLVAHAAERVFVTIPAWGDLLRRIAPRSRPAEWVPVPSNLPTDADPVPKPGAIVVGHFGTFGRVIVELLDPTLAAALRSDGERVGLLVGRGGIEFLGQFVARHPDLAGRVTATGELPPQGAAAHLAACDVLIQPYPDGVSGRRTSVLSGLALGVPLVTNLGRLTEPVWAAEENGLWLAEGPDVGALGRHLEAVLAAMPEERSIRGAAGRAWYRGRFAVERTVERLRVPSEGHRA